MKLRGNPGLIFSLLILAMFVVGVADARKWQFQARLFPWTIGIPALFLSVVQVALDLFRGQKPDAPEDVRGLMDLPVDRSVPVSVVIQRAANIFGWILGLFAAIWIVGFLISVPLFVLLYLLIQARESVWVAVIYTGVILITLLGVFHYVLHIPWPSGVISYPQELIISWIGE